MRETRGCLLDADREHALGLVGEDFVDDGFRIAQRALRVVMAADLAADREPHIGLRGSGGQVPLRGREYPPDLGDRRVDKSLRHLRLGRPGPGCKPACRCPKDQEPGFPRTPFVASHSAHPVCDPVPESLPEVGDSTHYCCDPLADTAMLHVFP
jgi:hypothetical protein